MSSRVVRTDVVAGLVRASTASRSRRCRRLFELGVASVVAWMTPSPMTAAEPIPGGIELRQVRPFTPTRSKPTSELTHDISPDGQPLPANFVDPDTLVIRPGEDPRLLAANPKMILAHEPAGFNTRPLFFEDVPLERLGQKCVPGVQPVVSAAKFFFAFPIMVPRCGQREAERFMGTTEPQYFGPLTPASPFSLDLSAEHLKTMPYPTTAPAELDKQSSLDATLMPASLDSLRRIDAEIVLVAGNEPIAGVEQVLPGFIHDPNAVSDVQPQAPYPTTAATVAAPTYETQQVANQYEVYTAQPVVAQRVVIQRAPQPGGPYAPMPVQTEQVVATQVAAPAPAPEFGYVLYPTADGGFVPVARQNVQVAAVPAPAPVVRQAAPQPADQSANVEADGRFPLLNHLIFGQLVSGESIPTPGTVRTPVGQPGAPAPMLEDGQAPQPYGPGSTVYEDGTYFSPEKCEPSCCWGGCSPYIGVEATFFAPLFDSPAISATAFDATTNYGFQSDSNASSYLAASPRITLGLGSCGGRGVRFRYWQLNTSNFGTDTLNLADPNDFTGFTTFGQFKAYTIDLESTREFCWCRRSLLASVGVRYVGLAQDESLYAQVLTQPVPDLLTAQATSSAQFYGTGITWGLQAIEPICNNCWGELDLFVGGRGSAIFGQNSSNVASSAQVGGAGIYAISNNEAQASESSTLMIGELQAGLQWNKCCNPCLPISRVFARGAFEYQYWGLTNGLETNANSFAGRVNVDQISINTDQRNFSNINLVGFSLSAGCYW